MAANVMLNPVTGSGFWRGLRPMLRRELGKWGRTRRWWLQTLVWLVIWDGMLAATLFMLPQLRDPAGQPLIPDDPLDMGRQIFAGMGTLGVAIGTILLLQDAIIDEKQSGTAEWVLSKPLSRGAFVLAKLIANVLGVLVTLLIIPGAVGYLLFRLYDPTAVSLGQVATAVAIIGLHDLFYLTLALLLGVVLQSRALLLAICFGSLLGGSMIPIELLTRISPWQLGQVATLALLGLPLDIGVSMLVATAVWSLLFTVLAVWRFRKLEF